MSRPTANRTWLQPRYSLRVLLSLFVLTSIVLAVWITLVESVRRQWSAAEPLLKLGATVETESTGWPAWVTWILPEGRDQNIIAVNFNRIRVTPPALDALQKLPHLRKLYMERTDVADSQLAQIAKLKSLRRLSLWGNRITDAGARPLVELPELELVDLSRDTGVTWRTLYAFRNRPDVEVKFDGRYWLAGDEIEQLASLGLDVERPLIRKVNDEQIAKAIQTFDKLQSLWIFADESPLTRQGLESIRDCRRISRVHLQFDDLASQSLVPMLHNVCEVWGPKSNLVAIHGNGNSFDFHLLGAETAPHRAPQQLLFRISHGPPKGNIYSDLRGLEEVDSLHFRDNPDSQTVEIVRSMPNLRHLELNWLLGVDESCCRVIAEIKSLESLKLDGPTYSHDAKLPLDFFARLACRGTLRNVVICNVGITREHLLPLLECPRLESLKIDDKQFESDRLDPKNWLPELKHGGI